MSTPRKLQFRDVLIQLLNRPKFRGARAQVADAVGVSPSALSHYTSGKSVPKIDVAARLADHLGVSTDYLIFGEEVSRGAKADDSMLKYVDGVISSYRQRIESHAWTSNRVAERLYDKLETIVSDIMANEIYSNSRQFAGIISDEEVIQLESLATEVSIISLNFQYDLQLDNGTAVPGRFAKIVAERLHAGAKYRIVLPQEDKYNRLALLYMDLMAQMAGSKGESNLQIKLSLNLPPSGMGIYKIDTDLADIEYPMLMAKIDDFVSGDMVGYVIPPSNLVQADNIMDKEHLARGQLYFSQIWGRANEPSK